MLPKNRAPAHPGQILQTRFLAPLGLSQREAASLLGLSQHRTINELCTGKRSVSPQMALILAKAFGTSPDLWLNLQHNYDLWHVQRERSTHARLAKVQTITLPQQALASA